MKKLLFLTICCLSLFTARLVFANETIPPEEHENYHPESYYEAEYDDAEYGYQDAEYGQTGPETAYPGYDDATPEEHPDDNPDIYNEEYTPEESDSFEPHMPPPAIPPPRYTSASVVVIDADTGLVLYGSEHNTPFYPASITKIMTALLVLEHVTDLTERIEFSDNAIWSIPRNSSHIAMDVGETLTVYQALYGLMLSSANEVSIALAEHVAGTVEAFAQAMNLRARQLGALNTNFVNPSGLHAPGHVSTAYDMSLIMREAIQHDIFNNIISALRFDIPPTERQPDVRHLLNTNRMINPHRVSYFNEAVVGGKTGWTFDAQHTLVTYARHEGRGLIITVLRADSGQTFVDTANLIEFGLSLPFRDTIVFEAATYVRRIPVYHESEGSRRGVGYVTIQGADDLVVALPLSFNRSDLRYDLFVHISPPGPEGLRSLWAGTDSLAQTDHILNRFG